MYKKDQFRTVAAIMTLAVFLAGCSAPSIPGIENASDGSEALEETGENAVTGEPAPENQEGAEKPAEAEETTAPETEENKEEPEAEAPEKEEEPEETVPAEAEETQAPAPEAEEEDPAEAMAPIAESAVYAYYFNEKYVDSLTASDPALFDTAMTAYAAEAISSGSAKRTMHGGKMTAAISAEDLKNAAFAMFPDCTEDILKAYDPSEYFHGAAEKDNYFITPASDDTYALVTGMEEGKKGSLEAEVSVMDSKGQELAGYKLTMDPYKGRDTTYAYVCSSLESLWKGGSESAFTLDTEELVPVLESLAKDSFTDKWEKEGQDAACRALVEWAFKNVDESREKDVMSALGDVTGTMLKDMDQSGLVRFLAVWPAVSQGMDNLLASEEMDDLLKEWQKEGEEPVIEMALARRQILGDAVYESIREVGFGTLAGSEEKPADQKAEKTADQAAEKTTEKPAEKNQKVQR